MRTIVNHNCGWIFRTDPVQKLRIFCEPISICHTVACKPCALGIAIDAENGGSRKIGAPNGKGSSPHYPDFNEVNRLIAPRRKQFLIVSKVIPENDTEEDLSVPSNTSMTSKSNMQLQLQPGNGDMAGPDRPGTSCTNPAPTFPRWLTRHGGRSLPRRRPVARARPVRRPPRCQD